MAHGCTYCTEDLHCQKFTDEKHTSWCYGEGYPCKDRRITNADRIRSMSDEELARYYAKRIVRCYGCEAVTEDDCFECQLEWLKAPAEEG